MAISNQQALAFIKRNPVGLGCGLLCVALGIFYYFRSDEQDLAQAELQEKSARAERLIENVKNAAQLKEQVDDMQRSAAAIEERLVHASELADNLGYFYKIEAETGTKLADLRQAPLVPVPKGSKTAYVAVPYVLTVHGDYPHLLDFLRRLENGPRYCVVTSATFAAKAAPGADTPSDAQSDPLTLTLNLNLLGVP